MTQYFEYGLKLSDNQKKSLASAMNSKSPLTLRIKNTNLTGNDELKKKLNSREFKNH